MENKFSLKSKFKTRLIKILEVFLWRVSFFLISLVMAKVSILEQCHPFGIAFFVSSFSTKFVIETFLGTIIGLSLVINTLESLKCISIIIFISTYKILFSQSIKNKKNDIYLVFLSNFIANVFVAVLKGIDIKSFLLCIIDSLICMFSTYIFKNGYKIATNQQNINLCKNANRILILYFTLIVLIISYPIIKIKCFGTFIINPLLISILLNFLLNRSKKSKVYNFGISFISFIQSFVYYISDNKLSKSFFFVWNLSSILTIFISDIFLKFNKENIGIFYFFLNIFLCLSFCNVLLKSYDFLMFVCELIFGIILFFILPKRFLEFINILFYEKFESLGSVHYISQKLNLFSEMFKKVNGIVETFSKKIHSKGYVIENDNKILFKKNLKNLSEICLDLHQKIEDFSVYDEEICAKLKFKMKYVFGNKTVVSCRYNSLNKVLIQMTINEKYFNVISKLKEISNEVSITCGKALSSPEIFDCGNRTILKFHEKANYNASVNVIQKSNKNSKYCGDNCMHFYDGIGNFYALINDGEGTGELASLDGYLVGKIIKKLIRTEIKYETAIEMANSALIIESERETTATVDLFSFDMFTGKAKLIKAGGTSTFLYKDGKIKNINSCTLPIGILPNVKSEEKTFSLNDGDVILMVSDGITNFNHDEWINPLLEKFHSKSEILINKIENIISEKNNSKTEETDDVTVMCINISKKV